MSALLCRMERPGCCQAPAQSATDATHVDEATRHVGGQTHRRWCRAALGASGSAPPMSWVSTSAYTCDLESYPNYVACSTKLDLPHRTCISIIQNTTTARSCCLGTPHFLSGINWPFHILSRDSWHSQDQGTDGSRAVSRRGYKDYLGRTRLIC